MPVAVPTSPSARARAATPMTIEVLLRRFLESYWLRPENAFWMTLRSATLKREMLRAPIADLACGDGVYTFLHSGGVLHPDFDVFLGAVPHGDISNLRHDMFDAASERYQPGILQGPDERIDLGLDLKPALLEKAGRLELYDRLVQHDANRPLPIADASLRTVYCNAAYWVREIDAFLREIRRTLTPDGRAILQVKLDSLNRYTLEPHRAALGDNFLEIIGRGRRDCWPTLAFRSEWERRFAAAGFHIDSATPFITRTHAYLWEVGLRPIAPLLVRMANALTAETRATIKRDWVDLFMQLLAPICDPAFELSAEPAEPAEIQYVLSAN